MGAPPSVQDFHPLGYDTFADIEQVKRPTITRVVDGLVQRGLVQRNENAKDGRASIIVATQDGQALWLAGQVRRAAPLAARIADLDPEARQQIERIMPLLAKIMAP